MKVINLAQYILMREAQCGRCTSNLRLQKLLYFVQCAFLQKTQKPAFSEPIVAWAYGPCVENVYYLFSPNGAAAIPTEGKHPLGLEGIHNLPYLKPLPEERRIINETLDDCAAFSATQLVRITQNQTPWMKAYQLKKQGVKEYVITPEAITAFLSCQ